MTRISSDVWSRLLALWGIASALLVLSPAARPRALALPLALSLVVAVGAGTLLFAVLARRMPAWPIRLPRRRAFVVKLALLTGRAAGEEVVWRWFVLAAIAGREGWLAGLAVSTLAFAAAHLRGQGWAALRVHAVTGSAFGAVFLVTGSLLAAIVAHAAYNGLVAAAAEQEAPERARPAAAAAAAPPAADRAAVAELVSVHKRLGTAQALAGVDLRLRRGEILGLLGPNGAGKTTALAVLLGLRRPDAGIVRLFGAPPTSRAARSRIGVCPQDVAFPPTLTVEEVARLTAAHFAAPADVRELLARFDLAHLRRRQCGGLSGGQRRLLAVALAFAGAPQAVFLDEPTTGLDVEARRSVWSEIRRFAEAGGTVLLTTHYLEEAEALAGRVAVLNGGVVVEEGPIGEVKARAGKRRVRLAAAPAASLLADVEIVPTDVGFECLVDDPGRLVRRLVAGGASLDGLEVSVLRLEEAFLRLTSEAET